MAADRFFMAVAFHAMRVAYVNDAGLNLYSEETQAQSSVKFSRIALAGPGGLSTETPSL